MQKIPEDGEELNLKGVNG